MKTKTSFKKDDPRINRNGAPRRDPVVKEIRELEKKELTIQFSNQLRMSKEDLRKIVMDEKTPIKELGIAKGILKWLETGDFRYVQPYIEYIFGKTVQRTEIDISFVYSFVQKISNVINSILSDKCPHCGHSLEFRDQTIRQLEIIAEEQQKAV